MLAYGVVVTLTQGTFRTWRFMLVRPIGDEDVRRGRGLTYGCDWIAWPLVYGAVTDQTVYVDSRNVTVVA